MAQSHVKKITSEMISLEKESIKFVPADYYYFVKVTIDSIPEDINSNEDDEDILQISHIAESLLKEITPKPIIVYYTSPTDLSSGSSSIIMMLFSCLDNNDADCINDSVNTREFDGNHNLIVSKYVSFFVKKFSSLRLSFDEQIPDINVSIVHIETQTKIFTYLSWIIFQVSQNRMIELSKGKITAKEIQFRTDGELKVILAKQNVIWDELDPHIKFGTILRCKHKKNGVNILRMSELLDARDAKKYLTFLFGV
jgi:hypothetical protein